MPIPASSLQTRQQGQPITAAVKHHLRLTCKASPETGQLPKRSVREHLLYVVKAAAFGRRGATAAGGRKRPSSPGASGLDRAGKLRVALRRSAILFGRMTVAHAGRMFAHGTRIVLLLVERRQAIVLPRRAIVRPCGTLTATVLLITRQLQSAGL